MDSTKPQPPPLLQALMLWGSLLASQGMVVLVSQTATVQGQIPPPDQLATPAAVAIDPWIWYSIALVIVVIATFLPRSLLKSAGARLSSVEDLRERAKVILPVWIVRWALIESVTMIGFADSMLTTNPAAIYPFAAVSLAGFLLTFPTESRLRAAA